MKKALIILLILTSNIALMAQGIEDALRLAQPDGIMTPRAGGLNVSYYGISDDLGALMYNPAGLALLPASEFSAAMGFRRMTNEVEFLGLSDNPFSSNNAYLSSIGLAAPFKTSSGQGCIAVGYFLEKDFENNYEYEGFNKNSTYISHMAAQGGPIADNFASYVWLADDNSLTPITDSLQQKAFVEESGGIHNITGSAAFNLTENFMLGFSLSGKFGSYDYMRTYESFDTKDLYNANTYRGEYNFYGTIYNNLDFDRLYMEEHISQSISGITGAIGFMGTFGKIIRFGGTIKFPTYFEVNETFDYDGTVYWGESGAPNTDRTRTTTPDQPYEFENSYKITSPWVFAAGISVNVLNLIFSAGVEYSDVTQTEFTDGTVDLRGYNKDIVKDLVGQTKWGVGVEYDIPIAPVVARASFASNTSPYVDDVPGATVNYVSLGGSLQISENVMLDGLFRWTDHTERRVHYGDETNAVNYNLTMSPVDIAVGIRYRF